MHSDSSKCAGTHIPVSAVATSPSSLSLAGGAPHAERSWEGERAENLRVTTLPVPRPDARLITCGHNATKYAAVHRALTVNELTDELVRHTVHAEHAADPLEAHRHALHAASYAVALLNRCQIQLEDHIS